MCEPATATTCDGQPYACRQGDGGKGKSFGSRMFDTGLTFVSHNSVKLHYVDGDLCKDNTNFTMVMRFECDNKLPDDTPPQEVTVYDCQVSSRSRVAPRLNA